MGSILKAVLMICSSRDNLHSTKNLESKSEKYDFSISTSFFLSSFKGLSKPLRIFHFRFPLTSSVLICVFHPQNNDDTRSIVYIIAAIKTPVCNKIHLSPAGH